MQPIGWTSAQRLRGPNRPLYLSHNGLFVTAAHAAHGWPCILHPYAAHPTDVVAGGFRLAGGFDNITEIVDLREWIRSTSSVFTSGGLEVRFALQDGCEIVYQRMGSR